MRKVIAIMNKPKNCEECIFGICKYSLPLSIHRKGYYCQLKEPKGRVAEDFDYYEEVHLSNCPLKELPEKQEDLPTNIYREGWNACIDKILKGSEENE